MGRSWTGWSTSATSSTGCESTWAEAIIYLYVRFRARYWRGLRMSIAEGMQGEQVSVAGENHLGVAGDRQGQEFVVLGIAAGCDGSDLFDEARTPAEKMKKAETPL